jgi:hypothetical protein
VQKARWWFDVALLAAAVLVTVALAARTPLLSVDLAVRDWCDVHRPGALYWAARVLNYAGQGGLVLTPLAAVVAVWLAWRRRSWWPFPPVVAAFLVTLVVVGPLKLWTDRAAPHSPIDHPEWLFHDPAGLSYPSGHVANAIVWYGVLALLLAGVLPARWLTWVRYGAPALVLVTTTYLSFHWLSDGLAAIPLGLVLDRLLRRVPWQTIPRAVARLRRA